MVAFCFVLFCPFFASPGLVGLALSYALSVINLLSGLITSFTQTETMMVSVERTEEYATEIPIESQEELLPVRLPCFAAVRVICLCRCRIFVFI